MLLIGSNGTSVSMQSFFFGNLEHEQTFIFYSSYFFVVEIRHKYPCTITDILEPHTSYIGRQGGMKKIMGILFF